MNPVIIFGSSHSFGKTRKVVDVLFEKSNIQFFDLNHMNISPFDYEHRNKHDDFIPLIKKLLCYDTWIIATPIYWYSMSTQHKIFFDRFADLLNFEKDLGRQLRGKKVFVVASFGESYPKGFDELFQQICNYLGMEYLRSILIYSGDDNTEYLKKNDDHMMKVKSIFGLC